MHCLYASVALALACAGAGAGDGMGESLNDVGGVESEERAVGDKA